jgi:hypothetical protein
MKTNDPPEAAVVALVDPDIATRRCWRCLQTFACAPDDVSPGPAQWWLCDPCQQSLIGPSTATQP